MLTVNHRDRGLPRHRHLERHRVLLAWPEMEATGDGAAVEHPGPVTLVVLVLGLDPGDHADQHLENVHVLVAAADVDLSAHILARTTVRRRQHGLHRRPANAEGSHQLFEDHRTSPPCLAARRSQSRVTPIPTQSSISRFPCETTECGHFT
jgi:hypothetical protein